MKMKLTDRTVQGLVPPAQGRVEVFDAKTPRLAVRVSAGGRKAWTAVWHRNGQVRRLTLGAYPAVTLADARERVLQIQAAVARGEDPVAERAERRTAPTVTALAGEYIERYAKPRKRSWEADQRTLDVDVLPVLGAMLVSEVQRKHVRAFLDGIIARGTAARPNRTHANRVRALLHSLFAFGVRRDLLTANPVDASPVIAQPPAASMRVTVSENFDSARARHTGSTGASRIGAVA